MTVEIISPEKILYTGSVHLVQVPGSSGSFEIMKNHAPIISSLEAGSIKVITDKGAQHFFETKGGFVELQKNKISILVE